MLRMLPVMLLGLSLAAGVRAVGPQAKATSKPQWQRLLAGDDARKAAELDKRIAEREKEGRYDEAIAAAEELLGLRARVQGPDHWETANAKWALAVLRKVAALPEPKRLGWRKAEQGEAEARRLEQQAQPAQALPLRRQRLTWCREVLGEDHPLTAESYSNLAANLYTRGRNAEAGTLFQKALDIFRKALGEGHPDTAASYGNVGANLNAQGRYAEAEPLCRKALAINRQILGEDHPSTATRYNNVAYNLNAQGRYAEAGPLYQKALAIRRRALGEGHPLTALSYNNLAANLNAQGRYAEAGPLFQKALGIFRKALGEGHPDTAAGYGNVAANQNAQGRYAEAGPLYQKALSITRKARGEDHPDTALRYNNLAFHLQAQGRYAEAEPLVQKALAIRRRARGEDHPDTAISYGNVAYNLNAQGRYAEAGPLYQKALDICRRALGENHPVTAQCYNNVASNLGAQGRYAEARPLLQKALDLRRRALGENHPDTALSYNNLAYNLYVQGKEAEALATLVQATRSYDAARLGVAAAGLDRAAFGAEHSPYTLLAAARARAGQPAAAWAALEAGLGRGLLDQLAQRQGLALTPAEQREREQLLPGRAALEGRILALVSRPRRTDAEGKELASLLDQRLALEQSLAALATTLSRREVAALGQLQAALPADAAFVAWVDIADRVGTMQEHWACVVRARGGPHWERLPGSGPEGQWTRDDRELSQQLRTALAQSAPTAEALVLARKLHAQRLAPLGKHLAGVKRLFVPPVNAMTGIPLEALTDAYTVSYTPSGTFLARLKDRPRPRSSGMLAVGDPLFPPAKELGQPTSLPPGGLLILQVVPGGAAAQARLRPGDVLVAYAGQDLSSAEQLGQLIAAQSGAKSVLARVWRAGQERPAERELPPGRLGVLLAKEPAREALAARREADELLARLTRGGDFAELPGTQVEIARLAALFDAGSVTKLTRADASEERLDELRRSGELKKYRYLHLATHGRGNDARAFESALILTRPQKLPEPRIGAPYLDGRLTAAEVLAYWQLDAELVTLSACESGLGRKGGGEGLLGFAQAFLLAGSRAVLLTLWQVDDTATALLMDRFYRNLLGKREDGARPLPKAEALREAKQWLRNLTAAEALDRLGVITQGVVRGPRPARQEMRPVPRPQDAPPDYRPYAHPRYWAAFALIGDPG
jgi:tetratricopeptide (TPR) repeat protein